MGCPLPEDHDHDHRVLGEEDHDHGIDYHITLSSDRPSGVRAGKVVGFRVRNSGPALRPWIAAACSPARPLTLISRDARPLIHIKMRIPDINDWHWHDEGGNSVEEVMVGVSKCFNSCVCTVQMPTHKSTCGMLHKHPCLSLHLPPSNSSSSRRAGTTITAASSRP